MKTLVAALMAVIAAIACEHANSQTIFQFVNISPASVGIDAPVFDADGNRLSGTNYVAMLYGGPTMDHLVPALLGEGGSVMPPIPFTYMPGGQAGYFNVRQVTDFGYVSIPIGGCGVVEWLQVVAWDLRVAATYEQAVSLGIGGYGASSLFQLRGGDPCLNPTPAEPLVGLQSFSLLQVVPEPGIWALLLLGLPGLWWLRRRTRDLSAKPRQGQ